MNFWIDGDFGSYDRCQKYFLENIHEFKTIRRGSRHKKERAFAKAAPDCS